VLVSFILCKLAVSALALVYGQHRCLKTAGCLPREWSPFSRPLNRPTCAGPVASRSG